MKTQPLVSIISPCLNGESYLHRLFDSILNQTYPNIEFIFINDGSTDNTEKVALSYKDKFLQRGIKFTYIYQENAGQAAAINQGLKIFKGEYLTWPDSDDWLEPSSLQKRVEYLQANPDKGLVINALDFILEDSMQPIGKFCRKADTKSSLFDDLILERNVCFAPVCYMVKSESFIKSLPSKHIYPSMAGQNWQMLLPITYQYNYGVIDEVLCHYLQRGDSHSRHEKTVQDNLKKVKNHQDILEHVINDIDMSPQQKDKYLKMISDKYAVKNFEIVCKEYRHSQVNQLYNQLKQKHLLNSKLRLKYIIATNKLAYKMYRLIKK